MRRRIDELSYAIRFTPRNPGSTWSAVNLKRVRALQRAGRMRPAGLKVFQERDRKKAGLYSFFEAPLKPAASRRHPIGRTPTGGTECPR